MLLWSEIYAPGDTIPGDSSTQRNAEAKTELEAARAAVEVILEHNNIVPESLKPAALSEYDWLAATEEDVDWREPGEVTLAIPDVRQLFPAFEYLKDKS